MRAKKIAVVLLFFLLGIGLLMIGRSSLNQLACEGQPINFRIEPTAEQQIWGEFILSQVFISPRNGLNRIDIMFQTYQRQNTHDIHVRLLEAWPNINNPLQNLQSVKEFTFKATVVPDRVWYRLGFPPLTDSAGKTYVIQLQSPDSVPGDAITVGGIEWDTYAPGMAFLGPTPVRADITFRACYSMTNLEKLQVLAEQLTQNRPYVWGHIGFYVVILIIYALLLSGFFWKVTRLIL